MADAVQGDVAEVGLLGMLKRGWLYYRPAPDLKVAKAFKNDYREQIPGRGPGPETTDRVESLETTLNEVWSTTLVHLHECPGSAIRAAIRDRIGSHIFIRPSAVFRGTFDAGSKFYPFAAIGNLELPSSDLAYYATVCEIEDNPSPKKLLCHRFAVTREDMHHLLHIEPALRKMRGHPDKLRKWSADYEDWLTTEDAPAPEFAPSASAADCEAEACAAVAQLRLGYRAFPLLGKNEISSMYAPWRSFIDLRQLADHVQTYQGINDRRATMSELTASLSPDEQRSTSQGQSKCGLNDFLPSERVLRIGREIADEALEHPFAWICHGIEARFQRTYRSLPNVSISVRKGGCKDLCYEIERVHHESFVCDLDDRGESLRANTQRSSGSRDRMRFTIRYPERWTLKDPNERVKVLQCVWLIDLFERPISLRAPRKYAKLIKEPRQFADSNNTGFLTALQRAVVSDALTSGESRHEPFSREAAQAMLAGCQLRLGDLAHHPGLGDDIVKFFRKEPEPRKHREIPIVGLVKEVEGGRVVIEPRHSGSLQIQQQAFDIGQFRSSNLPTVGQRIEIFEDRTRLSEGETAKDRFDWKPAPRIAIPITAAICTAVLAITVFLTPIESSWAVPLSGIALIVSWTTCLVIVHHQRRSSEH